MKLSRKQFLAGVAGVAVAGMVAPACGPDENGGGGDGGTLTDGGSANCRVPTISGNHGHRLVVPREDVEAGAEKSYSIRGDAPHDHTVTLTAAHMAQLAEGMSVTLDSSTDLAHDHTVTVTCA